MTTLTINGQQVTVDDSFEKLTPDQQEAEVNHIASQMGANKTTGGAAEPTPQGGGIPMAPAGAVIGAATGAATGPAIGKTIDTGINTAAKFINPAAAPQRDALTRALSGAPESNAPQAVQNWLKTQTSNPFAGGKDMGGAYKKSQLAAGEPVQSRGSNIPIRKGNLGIGNQLPEPTPSERVASSILNAERVGTPHMVRRVAGMGVAGGELGNLIEETEKGNYGRAALSGLGALGGAATQSRIKPVRAIGTGIAAAVPAIQYMLPEEKASGGLIHLASGGQPEMGTAQAYEPSYNERIRDAIAPYIGMQQARGLMGSQGADSESKYNPLSMLAQVPGSLGQNAKDFAHSSSEGDYLGAMGSYLSGAMDAAPLLGGPGKLARLLNYQAGNKAFDKGIDAAEPYIEKGAKAVAPTIAKGIRFIDDVLPKHKSVLADTHLSPNLYNGKHVQVEGHAVGGKIIEEGANLSKKLFAPRETKLVKLSEALGGHEGKKLGLTQTDNFGVHDGRMGGNQFPNFQNTSPLHAQDRVVWMNDSEKHAQDMINRGGLDTIWSTYIGAPDQLKSNKSVFNDILQQHYNRELTPEQVDLVNNRIATVTDSKKRLIFPQPFDIRDKFAATELGGDTFARRAAMADLLGAGEGVGKTRGGIALPEYQDILRSHRDPLTEGVPTSSVGTRLFTVDPNTPTKFSQEYHPDYNWTVHGEDQGVQFAPVPQNLAVPDWYNEINARAPGKTHGNAWFSYMKDPQTITEEYLTNLQKAGHKKGGKIKKKK